MSRSLVLSLGFSLVVIGSAAAQPRVPDTEMTAIGGDAGLFAPTQALQPTATVAGFYEYYLSPRRSVRIAAGWADPVFDREPGSLRHVRLTMNLLYNWEEGAWHPFVAGGGGVYVWQERGNGRSIGDRRAKAGVSFGGGVEYFARRLLTIKTEVAYHMVADKNAPVDPSGLTLTIGLKRYF